MSVQSNLVQARLWFIAAHQDLRVVDVLIREHIYGSACFHAQQCVEKSAKGILAAADIPIPKTHSIGALVSKLPLPDMEDDIRKLLHTASKLDRMYMPTRYPDAGISENGIDADFDFDDAISARDTCGKAYQFFARWATNLEVPLEDDLQMVGPLFAVSEHTECSHQEEDTSTPE